MGDIITGEYQTQEIQQTKCMIITSICVTSEHLNQITKSYIIILLLL